MLLLVAFSHCFSKCLQFVLLFASFVFIFEEKHLKPVAFVVQHYRSYQISSLKNHIKVAKSKTICGYLKKNILKMLRATVIPSSKLVHVIVQFLRPKACLHYQTNNNYRHGWSLAKKITLSCALFSFDRNFSNSSISSILTVSACKQEPKPEVLDRSNFSC